MDIQHLNAKFFVENPAAIDLEAFLVIFNRWIQDHVCEELLIDVADYRHVFAGPGVVLIGHEANYSMDNTGNRLGLLYNRKAVMNGDVQDRLPRVVRSTLLACQRLQADPLLQGKLKFNGQELQLLINDRLIAPNTRETLSAIKPELKIFFAKLYGGATYTLEGNLDLRERFTVSVKAAGHFDIAGLLKNLCMEQVNA